MAEKNLTGIFRGDDREGKGRLFEAAFSFSECKVSLQFSEPQITGMMKMGRRFFDVAEKNLTGIFRGDDRECKDLLFEAVLFFFGVQDSLAVSEPQITGMMKMSRNFFRC